MQIKNGQKIKFYSLSMRLLALTALWVSFVVGVIGYTMLLSWDTESSAAALSQISEIKLSFHRARVFANPEYSPQLLQGEIRQSEKLIAGLREKDLWRPFKLPDTPQVNEGIEGVARVWAADVRPHLLEIQGGGATGEIFNSEAFHRYIGALDFLKTSIDGYRQSYLEQMRYLQILIMILAIGSLFVILYLLNAWVIRPVNALGRVIDQVTAGDLSSRVKVAGRHDELWQIGMGFNRMTERLEDLYNNLEEKVAEKTASVREKNTNLAQLYEMTTFLSQAGGIEEMCEGFLERIISYTKADGCAVRFYDSEQERLGFSASIGLSGQYLEIATKEGREESPFYEAFRKPLPVRLDFTKIRAAGASQLVADGFRCGYVFHLRNGQNNLGVFEIEFKSDQDIPSPVFRQLESFGTHLAVAVDNYRLNERERQFAVVQERTFMAQGLHDSIAQTLSFLNMQVQFLESALSANDKPMIDETVQQIKAGVQESYENVRELLLNFREKIHKEDFQTAVQTVTRRFEAQSGVDAKVVHIGKGPKLTEKQKLQITFIIQEALSNIRKHAKATKVEVRVENGDDFSASVTDNGVGIDQKLAEERRAQHVGLSIMDERAKKIGATLSITSKPGKGTCVKVSLPAEARNPDYRPQRSAQSGRAAA